jgi:transcriptional regulator with XRE-family HTH domain
MNLLKSLKNKLNQEEIAKHFNVSQGYVSLIISGKRKGPSAKKRLKQIHNYILEQIQKAA